MALDVLLVEDEKDISDLMIDVLEEEGYFVRAAKNSKEAFLKIQQNVPNIIVLDIWLKGSDLDGIGILKRVKESYPLLPIVIISGHGTIENAVHAIKLGAYHYVTKPFNHEDLVLTIKRAYENAKLKKENTILKYNFNINFFLFGKSKEIIKLKSKLSSISDKVKNIMILGEDELEIDSIVRNIYNYSSKANKSLLKISPSSLSKKEILVNNSKKIQSSEISSIIKKSNESTLYIQDITFFNREDQLLLLRFLQTGSLGNNLINTRVIVSCSEEKINTMLEKDMFISDLYSILSLKKFIIPSLFKRKEDIIDMCIHWIDYFCDFFSKQKVYLSDKVKNIILSYHWPKNTIELRNFIEWIVLHHAESTREKIISSAMLPNIINEDKKYNNFSDEKYANLSMKDAKINFEKEYIMLQMKLHNNKISKVAKAIKMERSTLHRKIKSLDIKF